MKKYKIIKDFPGNSEKIGDFIKFHIGTFPEYFGPSGKKYCAKDIENYPEFLEEVVELDYEILSFIGKNNQELRRYGNMCYGSHGGEYSMIQCLESRLEIKTIKRLSDNEVFSVGDLVNLGNVISAIEVGGNELFISFTGVSCYGGYVNIEHLKHVKKPLFVTEDQVEIFEGDYYWYTYTNNLCCCRFTAGNSGCVSNTFNHKNKLSFSTKELCDAYNDENKPKYSELDMVSFGKSIQSRFVKPTWPVTEFLKTWKGKNGKN